MHDSHDALVALNGRRHLGQRYLPSDLLTRDDPHLGQCGRVPNAARLTRERHLDSDGI